MFDDLLGPREPKTMSGCDQERQPKKPRKRTKLTTLRGKIQKNPGIAKYDEPEVKDECDCVKDECDCGDCDDDCDDGNKYPDEDLDPDGDLGYDLDNELCEDCGHPMDMCDCEDLWDTSNEVDKDGQDSGW